MLKIITTNIALGVLIVAATAVLCRIIGIEFTGSSSIVATLWSFAKTIHDLIKLDTKN